MMLALVIEALVYRSVDVLVALAPVAGLVLATVFVIAAVTKTIDRPATTREFTELGLPKPALLARVVPPVELVIAVLLVARPAIGAAVAALALLAFTALLAAVLRSGRTVSCGCLGALSREPVSSMTILRNGALLALAALASAGPTPTGFDVALPAIEVALATGTAATIGLVGHQLLSLRHQIGRLWSVELAGERPTRGGRRSHHHQSNRGNNRAHADRAVVKGVVS